MFDLLLEFESTCKEIVLKDESTMRLHPESTLSDIQVVSITNSNGVLSSIVKPAVGSSLTFLCKKRVQSQVVSVEIQSFHSKFTVII